MEPVKEKEIVLQSVTILWAIWQQQNSFVFSTTHLSIPQTIALAKEVQKSVWTIVVGGSLRAEGCREGITWVCDNKLQEKYIEML
ncbi:hypothetical protein CsSME_00011316 [Camellia sinensis var. sinensis]